MNKESFLKKNRTKLTAAGAVLIAATAVYQNKDALQDKLINFKNKNITQEQTHEEQKFPQLELPQEAKEILETNKALVCSYRNGFNDYLLYVSDKHEERQIKEIATENLRHYHEHLFIKGKTAYQWNNLSTQGFKFALNNERVTQLFYNLRKIQEPGIIGQFQCNPWKTDESQFELPKNINFKEWPPKPNHK
jgi:hypothetical protein